MHILVDACNDLASAYRGHIMDFIVDLFLCRYVKPPIFTLCVGNAWGEAALLLAAGARGNRYALPLSTITMKQVLSRKLWLCFEYYCVRFKLKHSEIV